MRTTTYICDTCKKSVSEAELVPIEVSVENICFVRTDRVRRGRARLEICKDCLRKKGFVIESVTKDTEEEVATKNAKTLESRILDILDDLGVAFQE